MQAPRKRINPQNLTTYGHSRAVRLPDCSYAGDEIIHVTICANRGKPFANWQLAELVSASVGFYCHKLKYRLFGYCLMPNHLHVLLSPASSGTPLGKWLLTFKNYTGRMFANAGGTPPLWQRSAYDHVCRNDETPERVLAYIVDNPVRAGLVQSWPNWPWTGVFIEI
jgi:REP element-mobilizing transposase RayT